MSQLAGKVALVTGASKGIGAAIAERLAADGAAVIVNYSRSKDEAQRLVQRIGQAGGSAIALQADVAEEGEVERLFRDALAWRGRLDILVNNAGVYDFRPITAVDSAFIDRQWGLNVRGLLLASREAVRHFEQNGGGTIVNVSSVVSDTPPPNSSVYSATKGAVDVITKTLALELGAKGVRVNGVAPGLTLTEGAKDIESTDFGAIALNRTPLGRLGKPEDIADVVAFLVSPQSGWVTGQTLAASGGLRL